MSSVAAAAERGFRHVAKRPRANTQARQASQARAALGPISVELLDLAPRLRDLDQNTWADFLYDVYTDLLKDMGYGGDWLPQLTRDLEAWALTAATVTRDARGRLGRIVPRRWWSRPTAVAC